MGLFDQIAGIQGAALTQAQSLANLGQSVGLYRDHQYWDAHIRRPMTSIMKVRDSAEELKQEMQSDLDEYLKDWRD